MRASILTIGNEILKGRTINTNFSHIGRVLTFAGYDVYRGIVVRDDPDEIAWGITQCLGFSDLVVTSGGLGPTFDDMTVRCISDALGLPVETNAEALSMIRSKYLAQNLELTPERMKMAMLPRGSEPLPNPVGTAPGVFLQYRGRTVVILPGVPSEMKAILDSIISRIRVRDRAYYEDSITLQGVMESTFAPIVAEEMKLAGGSVYIKSHPVSFELSTPVLEIEVSASATDNSAAKNLVEATLKRLRAKYDELLKGKTLR